jgi:hypothetical protein
MMLPKWKRQEDDARAVDSSDGQSPTRNESWHAAELQHRRVTTLTKWQDGRTKVTGTHLTFTKSHPDFVALIIFLLFALMPLLFAAYTKNGWEDYYITFRASRNLALGHGLVFTAGERIHSFTSPLGVLIPALCSVVAGTGHDSAAFWLFRVVSAIGFGLTGVLIYLALRRLGLSDGLLWMTLILLALDAKTVMFSANGMETSFMLFFLSLSLYVLTAGPTPPAFYLGLAWGGVMWARPDGFVYAGALAIAFLAFKAGAASVHGRTWLLKRFLYACLLAALIYSPWFLWAWNYYGTPIPHTVIAKGLTHGHGSTLLSMLGSRLNWDRFAQTFPEIFMPAYSWVFGGWDPKVELWGWILLALAVIPLVLPGMPRFAKAVSAAFIGSCIYLYFVIPFGAAPWYMPSGAWLGYIAIGLLFNEWFTHSSLRSVGARLTAAAAVIIPQTIVLCLVFQQIAA